MKAFANEAKEISIIFVCDACGEDTIVEHVNVPTQGEIIISAVCPVCFKDFDVKIGPGWVSIEDVDNDDIKVTIL